MRIFPWVLMLGMSFGGVVAHGATKEEQLKDLHGKIGAVKELSADFSQTVYRSMRKKKTESKGKAYFLSPDRFRWIVETPIKEEFRFDGKSLMIIRPEEKLATRYVGMAAQTREIQQIVSMVLDLKSLSARYDLKSLEHKGETYQLVFTPKTPQIDLREVEIDIVAPTYFVNRVKMNYPENYTEIVFSNQSKSIPTGILDEKLAANIKIKELK